MLINLTTQMKSPRKQKQEEATDKFKDLVDFGDINENDNLEYLVNQMNSTTTKLLDKCIPEKKTMKITERRKE